MQENTDSIAAVVTKDPLQHIANVYRSNFVLKQLTNKVRQQIIRLLIQNGPQCVTDICSELKLPQAIASQNLSLLRRAVLVKVETDGKKRYYSVNRERLGQIFKWSELFENDNRSKGRFNPLSVSQA